MGFFTRDLGIDLGTANTLVYMRGKGIIIREPSVVAVKVSGSRKEVLAVGERAKNMIGRTPGNIVAVKPLRDGVIADFDVTAAMLSDIIHRAMPRAFSLIRTRVVICVPCGVTGVERKAVEDAAKNAGASHVEIIEEPKASAIGAGLPINEPSGCMIVDIGGGSSEMAVISLGGIVVSRSLRIAGNKLDDAIMNFVKKEFNLAIGERTSEEIKVRIGSAYPTGEEESMEIRGRDLISGLPKTVTITSTHVREALREPLMAIIDAVKVTLEDTPPELAADIMERGIYLAGGGALLKGMDTLIKYETGMPVVIADSPLDCVVTGAGMALEDLDYLS
jgi:rod shape-determining protein MreB